MANTITTKLDLDGKGFVSQLRGVQTSISQAEGGIGKLKAGASGLGQVFKANIAEAAAAAGGALIAFGVSATKAFQDTALEAGKFADATGLSVEEASRLAEVAGDVGIELGTVQGALLRFNKAAADGVVEVENFGNAVVRASDGTVDAYQSFINAATAIGAIEDPARRAQAAQETFGRSYGEIAELMEMDATELRDALASVGDAQVIDESELEKAKAFREGMDRITDAIGSLQLAVGEAIAGNSELLGTFAASLETMSKYADEATTIADAFLIVTNPLYGFQRALGAATDEIDLSTASLEELEGFLRATGASQEERAAAIAAYASAQALANDEVARGTGIVAGYNAEVSKNANVEVTAAENRRRNAEEARNSAQAIDALLRRLGPYSDALNAIDEDVYTEIKAALNAGDLARAESLLNQVTRSRIVQVGIAINQGALAGAAAGAAGPVGQSIGASIASAIAGAKMPSSVSGGGGGGGGGGSSPAEKEATSWADAIARAYEYGELTRDEYRKYLSDRLAGEEKYGAEYDRTWKQIQALDKEAADERQRAVDERVKAEKEAADIAKKAADEAERRALRQQELDAIKAGAREGIMAGFSGMASVTNIYTNNPETLLEASRAWERNNGPMWQAGTT